MTAVLFAVFVLTCPAGLFADTAGAKAAYGRGAQAMSAKDYSRAISEFSASLLEDPGYFYAHKQLGTAYYMQGDKAAALEHYDAYLSKAPYDTQLKAFAERLRPAAVPVALSAPAPAAAAPPVADAALGMGVGLRLGASWAVAHSLIPVCCDASNNHVAADLGAGLGYMAEALYPLNSSWELGLGISPLSASGSSSTKTETTPATEMSLKIDGGTFPIFFMVYARAPLGKQMTGIVGFGPSFGTGGTVSSSFEDKNFVSAGSVGKGSDKYTLDSGVGYRGYLGGEYAFSRHLSLFFGFEMQSLSLGVGKRVIEYSATEANGDTHMTTTNYEYSVNPPQQKTPTGSSYSYYSGNKYIQKYSYDEGNYSYTGTDTFDLSTGRTESKFERVVKDSKTNLDFHRLAPVIGLTVRF